MMDATRTKEKDMPPESHIHTLEDTGRAIIRDVERGIYTEQQGALYLAVLHGAAREAVPIPPA